jgi:hypothetical protein
MHLTRWLINIISRFSFPFDEAHSTLTASKIKWKTERERERERERGGGERRIEYRTLFLSENSTFPSNIAECVCSLRAGIILTDVSFDTGLGCCSTGTSRERTVLYSIPFYLVLSSPSALTRLHRRRVIQFSRARSLATCFSASANAKHLIHGQKCWPPAPIGVVPCLRERQKRE